jgi:hypothetical protein
MYVTAFSVTEHVHAVVARKTKHEPTHHIGTAIDENQPNCPRATPF